ncbi:Fanconi anemia group J protein [Mortierella sp. GBA30]|nr:Fanconi anemia group J protein [Mortierella sp. GBA30]
MVKRTRTLPQSILKGKGKGKGSASASHNGDSDQGKQTHLMIHADDTSDSDFNANDSASSRKSSPKAGHFVQARKRQKTPTANSAASKTAAAPTEFITRGIRVKFPFAPYQSQQDMMSRIVEALQKQENALLESPTGSGKSLALLCGALAWLESEKERREAQRNARAEALEKELAKQGVVESPYFANDSDNSLTVPSCPPAEAASCGTDSNSTVNPDKVPGCGSCPGSCTSGAQPIFNESSTSSVTSSAQDGKLSPGPVSESKPIIARVKQESSEDEQDFQTPRSTGMKRHEKVVELKYESEAPTLETKETAQAKHADSTDYNCSSQPLPKIYFGSRTHKQITQLVKELKSNTVYRPKMVVLGSRNHYCINPKLKKVINKNDACQELLDAETCFYKHHTADLSEKFLIPKKGVNRIWDMEDLIAEGKAVYGCPYFAARSLALGAELIFCPYSYLIDPQIRKAMDIDLDNAIVILDEAHNIEDAAREAGGLDVLDEDLRIAKLEFADMVKHHILTNTCHMLLNVSRFVMRPLPWSSQEMLTNLDRFGLNRHTIRNYDNACQEISKALKEKKEKQKNAALSTADESEKHVTMQVNVSPRALRAMEGIVVILTRLLSTDYDCLDDYKIALVESLDRTSAAEEVNSGEEAEGSEDEGGNTDAQAKKARSGRGSKKWPFTKSQTRSAGHNAANRKKREFKFWCLNPGVIFRPLSTRVRSVILTSGTLSPMDSFASELQTTFPVRLEADHVIDKSQVWTGVLPYGPTGIKVDGTFRSVSSFAFQDELGRVVEKIISTTPHGVLCFVSSYHLLDNLMTRWRSTGQYDALCGIKKVLQEPRRATAKIFDKTLREFYDHISTEVSKGSDGGALLFAVFRGKCSEGIDFTDSNCRAVLAVGIPFPNSKDLKVQLKKEYNDKQCERHRQNRYLHPTFANGAAPRPLAHINIQGLNHTSGASALSAAHAALVTQQMQASRPLLSGNRWYEIQAFRAYNQAIGRCIRHRKDWGAMALLDFRFTQPNHRQNLSKWVRPLVKTYTDFEQGINNMVSWIAPLQQGCVTPPLVPSADIGADPVAEAVQQVDTLVPTSTDDHDLQSMAVHVTPAAELSFQDVDVNMQDLERSVELETIQEQSIPQTLSLILEVQENDVTAITPFACSTPTGPVDQHCLLEENASGGQQEEIGGIDMNSQMTDTDVNVAQHIAVFIPSSPVMQTQAEIDHNVQDVTDIDTKTNEFVLGGEVFASSGKEQQPANPFQPHTPPVLSRSNSNAHGASLGLNLPLDNTSQMLAGEWTKTIVQGTSTPGAFKIICKTCSKYLFSCSEKPKIKSIQKSMANELYRQFLLRRQMQQATHSASSPRPSRRISMGQDPPAIAAFTRTLSDTSLSRGDTGNANTLSKNILIVSRSFVLELTPEIRGEQEELESANGDTDGGVVPGWRGVMIAGSSDGRGLATEGTEEGTIWLIQGEFRVV